MLVAKLRPACQTIISQFQIKDDYGNEVTQLARPLPVEYLLLDLPAAFPVEPVFTFHGADAYKPFPIENRSHIGELHDFNAFSSYMQQFPKDKLLEATSDFHLLLFMATCDMLPLKVRYSGVWNMIDVFNIYPLIWLRNPTKKLHGNIHLPWTPWRHQSFLSFLFSDFDTSDKKSGHV